VTGVAGGEHLSTAQQGVLEALTLEHSTNEITSAG
jgi:hypothetical protein